MAVPCRGHSSAGRATCPSWADWPLAIAAAAISLYFLVFFDDIFIRRVGSPIAQDYMMGVLAIILVMEATRRTMGNLLPAIGMACLLYALFGRYLPGVLAHRGYSVVRVVNHIYIGTEGIYGIAVGVVATYVFHFVLFGILAQMTGLGRLFMDLATIVAGRYVGGPAKISVVCTTTMIADMARRIAGPDAEVLGIMRVGEDPHVYEVRPRDAQ